MGSKDKKSKKEEDPEEEEGKKKKKDKKKKGSVKGDSDEDTKKTKGKKKKIENYVEIYEKELRTYEPEKVENYEDEYHKKKGKLSFITCKMQNSRWGSSRCKICIFRRIKDNIMSVLLQESYSTPRGQVDLCSFRSLTVSSSVAALV